MAATPAEQRDASDSKPDPQLPKTFAKRMIGSLLPGDAAFTKEALAGAARFVLDAAASRAPGEAVVRLSSAAEGRRFMRIALVNDDMPFLVDSIAAAVSS